MSMERLVNQVGATPPASGAPVRPDARPKGPARRLDLPPVVKEEKPPVTDRVDLHTTERMTQPEKTDTDFQYEVSETQDLVVKVVNARDRSEVIRQYPSEDILKFRSAYHDFLSLLGLGK